MIRMRRLALKALLFVLLAGGPAAVVASPVSLPEQMAAAALQQGVESYSAGRHEDALSQLRGLVIRYPESPLVPQAYLYLARIFYDKGQPRDALLYLNRIPPLRKGDQERLIEGGALVAIGQTERGVAILQGLETADLSVVDRQLRYAALAEGNLRLGRTLPALFFLHRSLRDGHHPNAAGVLQQARQLLRGHLSDAELAEAAFMLAGTAIGADALLQLALRAQARGDDAQALRQVEAVVRSDIDFPYRPQAQELYRLLSGGEWAQRRIGVVLPLSGRFGPFGNLVRRGLDLAVEQWSVNRPGLQLIYRDSQSDTEMTRRAITELAEQGVLAVIGPLTGNAAMAAAEEAQRNRIPLLSLSQREGVPEVGNLIFRHALTNQMQIEALVAYAMEEKQLRTFATLVPETRQGREMAELFTQAILSRGGKVLRAEEYAENATDFRRQIMRLRGRNPDAPEERGGLREVETPPFQALFIPDFADRVGPLLPQLPYYGLQGVQLLGINGWNSPELLRVAGRHAEGAVFVDGFFKHSHFPFVREFVDQYHEKYGEEPSILEAQGYDAAGMLLSLLDNPRLQSREELRQGLQQLRNYPGVTGATSFTPGGEADKVLFLLQVHNGNIEQIN
jgi:branched-chain amino acid transport system substrate-binding protein